MRTLTKLLLTTVLFITGATAQNTVSQNFLNLTPSINAITIGPLRNIGQTTHFFTLQYVTPGGNPCIPYYTTTSPLVDPIINLIVSSIASPTTAIPIQYIPLLQIPTGASAELSFNSKSYAGVGSGPYLYISVNQLSNTCRVNAYYTGSVSGSGTSAFYRTATQFQGSSLSSIPQWVQRQCNGPSGTVVIAGSDPPGNNNQQVGIIQLVVGSTGGTSGNLQLFSVDRAGAQSTIFAVPYTASSGPAVINAIDAPLVMSLHGGNFSALCSNGSVSISALVNYY